MTTSIEATMPACGTQPWRYSPEYPAGPPARSPSAGVNGNSLRGLGWLAYCASPAPPAEAERMRSGGDLYKLSLLSCWASASTKSC